MKLIILFFAILYSSTQYLFAETLECNKYKKVSKEYTLCTSNLVKEKTIEIKEKTSAKIADGKKKYDKSNFKKKLLKLKNSKTLKEFIKN